MQFPSSQTRGTISKLLCGSRRFITPWVSLVSLLHLLLDLLATLYALSRVYSFLSTIHNVLAIDFSNEDPTYLS
jgi:hypothetical protein